MDFTIDAFQRELKTGIRKQLGVLGPAAEDPEALWSALSELALPALEAPAASGGLELGLSNSVVAWEELGAATACGPLWSTVFTIDCAADADPGSPLDGALPGLLSGESRAEVTGLGAVGPAADGVLVRLDSPAEPFALSDSGLTPAVLGPAVSRAQVRQAAFLVGMAREALDIAAAHVREREQFGHKLVDFEAVSFPLAALLIDLEASRLAVHRAAWLSDTGRAVELAAVEVLAGAGDLLATAARTAIHVHGTRGLLRTNRVARIYLRARDEIPRLGTPRALWRRAGLLRITGGIDPDDRAAIC